MFCWCSSWPQIFGVNLIHWKKPRNTVGPGFFPGKFVPASNLSPILSEISTENAFELNAPVEATFYLLLQPVMQRTLSVCDFNRTATVFGFVPKSNFNQPSGALLCPLKPFPELIFSAIPN